MKARMTRLNAIFRSGASSLQSPLLLLIRLYWGWQFAQTGWGKLLHLSRFTAYFYQLGIPLPHLSALFVGLLELCGGILMAIGLFSRPVALLLAIDMIAAYVVADTAALKSFFSNPGDFYSADPFTFLAASLIVLIFGPGFFALDTFIDRSTHRQSVPGRRLK